MLNVINSNFDSFIKYARERKVVIYGAGKKARHFLENYDLSDYEVILVDRNPQIDKMEVNNIVYDVFRFNELKRIASLEKVVILISTAYFSLEIIEQLDKVEELDSSPCFILDMMQDYLGNDCLSFSKGKAIIPKKIHYCWFGDNKKSALMEECISSWHEMCPDYEIVCWNEKNYDIAKNKYMLDAYKMGRMGFVPDYARLDIIYNEGGIYLDTDVKLIRPLDDLLCDEFYFGLNFTYRSNLGLGFGAVKGHELVGKLRDVYNEIEFVDEYGNVNDKNCAYYQDPILREYGFTLKNTYEKVNNSVCYPSNILNPSGTSGFANNFTIQTISIHYGTSTWLDESTAKEYARYRECIQQRILDVK